MSTPADAGEVAAMLGVGRFHASDEQGIGLQATWRPDHGFINLSLWRGDRCVETFHLTPDQASALVGFVAHSLAQSVPPPSRGALAAVLPIAPLVTRRSGARDAVARLRLRLAGRWPLSH